MIKTPDLKDMEFSDIIDQQAGQCLMQLGSGTSMRNLVQQTMMLALSWKQERDRDKALKEQEKKA